MILYAHRIYIELEPTNKDARPLTERPYLRSAARRQQISPPVSFSVLSYVRAAAIQTIHSGLCAPLLRSPPVHLRFFCPARPPSSPSTPLSCRVETPLPSKPQAGKQGRGGGGRLVISGRTPSRSEVFFLPGGGSRRKLRSASLTPPGDSELDGHRWTDRALSVFPFFLLLPSPPPSFFFF